MPNCRCGAELPTRRPGIPGRPALWCSRTCSKRHYRGHKGATICTDCGVGMRCAMTDEPRCRPCRTRRWGELNRHRMSPSQRRHRDAERKLAKAATGTCGSVPIIEGPCAWCGQRFSIRRSDARYCSESCDRRARRRRRATREHGGTGWTWAAFMHIAHRFGYCCAYCGDKPAKLQPDHVVPLARDGDDSLSNLLPVCAPCNSDKRDLLLDEWAADRARRGLPERNTTCDYPHLALRSVPARAA